jgi:TatD DNase family protein
LELVNQYKFDASIPFFSIGIHPWYIEDRMEAILNNRKQVRKVIVATG